MNTLLNNISINAIGDVRFINSPTIEFSDNHSIEENYTKLIFICKEDVIKHQDNFDKVMQQLKYRISSGIDVWVNQYDVRIEHQVKIVNTKIVTEIYKYKHGRVEPNRYEFEYDFYLTTDEIMDYGFWKLRSEVQKVIDKY